MKHVYVDSEQSAVYYPDTNVSQGLVNLRRRALHVVPASAEVVPELAERSDAQLLLELRVLLLLGQQDLLQCADLFFQLATHRQIVCLFLLS